MRHRHPAAHADLLRALLSSTLISLCSGLVLPSCTGGRITFWTCENPCKECEDPCGDCAAGTCVPLPALDWQGPVLLWFGPPDEEPDCPAQAPAIVYEGYAHPSWPNPCGRCACEPPSCTLPEEIAATSTNVTCWAPSHTATLPAGWDGSCRPIASLPAPESVFVEGTGVTACKPVLAEPPAPDVVWRTKAKACASSKSLDACQDSATLCAPPAGDTMPGARQCIYHRDADVTCPAGYPQRFQFQEDVSDTITCSPCSCLPPAGSACEATLDAYADASCMQAVHTTEVTLGVESCEPPSPVPAQIASVEAYFTVNLPGSCAPQGGQITRGGEPVRAATFCCMAP